MKNAGVKDLDNVWVHDEYIFWTSGNFYYRVKYSKDDCKCFKTSGHKELVLDVTEMIGEGYSMVGSFEVLGDLVAVGIDTIGIYHQL